MELSKKDLEIIQRFAEGKTCNRLCSEECIFNSGNKNSIGLKCITISKIRNGNEERTKFCIDYLKKLKEEQMNNLKLEKIILDNEEYELDIEEIKKLGLIKKVNKPLIDETNNYTLGGEMRIFECLGKEKRILHGNVYSNKEVAKNKSNIIGGLNGRIQTAILEENFKVGLDGKFIKQKSDITIYYDSNDKVYRTVGLNTAEIIGAVYTTKEIAEKICERLNKGDR